MRVLLVAPYFYPEGGGLERYAYKMAKELSEENEVVVVCATKLYERTEKIGNIKVIRKKPNLIISNTPVRVLLPFELIRMIKRQNFDVIIAHTPVPFFADVASFAAKLMGKPITIVYHTGELKKGSWTDVLAGFYERTVEKMTLRNTKIISVSRYVQRILGGRKGGFHSKVEYPKIDEAFILERPDFRGDGNTVLFVGQLGRFHRWKNLDLLLRALVLVKREIPPDVKLVVIGGGDLIGYYTKLAEDLGLEGNVEFLGRVSRERLISSYKSAKLLVLRHPRARPLGWLSWRPSLWGGLPP
ncbi:glycosyltransferase family 4 protein [Thermococcus sp. JCM 11816]|uniref:glycosyltransferase family 4 protein n=1 Tax=Thermococcus sp. (strain JCM 11816 / KS-1) TaxID=1295125 RepID=UPI000A78355D